MARDVIVEMAARKYFFLVATIGAFLALLSVGGMMHVIAAIWGLVLVGKIAATVAVISFAMMVALAAIYFYLVNVFVSEKESEL